MPSSWPPRPSPRLVLHDILLERRMTESGVQRVEALIYCERRAVEMRVDECGACERFARVEAHEAGYAMLCRSQDVELEELLAEVEDLDE